MAKRVVQPALTDSRTEGARVRGAQQSQSDAALAAAKRNGMIFVGKSNLGAWSLIAVMFVILAAAGVYAYQGLTVEPAVGYVALGFGAFFSLIVGIGLMALLFYSNRAGFDDAAQSELKDSDGGPRPTDSR
jgi:hypothetical protein